MSKVLELIRAGQKKQSPRRKPQHKAGRSLPRFRCRVDAVGVRVKALPHSALKHATLTWAFCSAECFISAARKDQYELYLIDHGQVSPSEVRLTATLWNYRLSPQEVPLVLLERFLRALRREENAPEQIQMEIFEECATPLHAGER